MAKRILIVDDEPKFLELLKIRLEANDYQVMTAEDGKEAISVVKDFMPDLIVMDVLMPEMSGGDVAKVLHSNSFTKNIPIIMLTGIVEKTDLASGINIGGVYYPAFPKPFDSQALLMKIAAILENKE